MPKSKLIMVVNATATLNKYDGRARRNDLISKLGKKWLRIPEKQPVEVIVSKYKDGIKQSKQITRTEWKSSTFRYKCESYHDMLEKFIVYCVYKIRSLKARLKGKV